MFFESRIKIYTTKNSSTFFASYIQTHKLNETRKLINIFEESLKFFLNENKDINITDIDSIVFEYRIMPLERKEKSVFINPNNEIIEN